MGADPEDFGPAAQRLVAAGFDVVDINFGCPVRKVLGRCRGGYLLGQVDTALEIVSRVREAVPPHDAGHRQNAPRPGRQPQSRDKFFRSSTAHSPAAWRRSPCTAARSQQKYVGPSRWEFLREVKRHAGARVVLGSGDLFTAAGLPRHDASKPASTASPPPAARSAIRGSFAQARALAAGQPLPDPPTVHEQRDVIAEHYRLAEKLYGPEHCGRQMRKFGIKYSQLHPRSERSPRRVHRRVAARPVAQACWTRGTPEDGPGRHPASQDDLQDCQEAAPAA